MIERQRIKSINNKKIQQGEYVLYWMQASQRTEYNQALEYAIEEANLMDQPLLVLFTLNDKMAEVNERNYYFILEGLKEVERNLTIRGIKFITLYQSPPEAVKRLSKQASLVIVDRDYLKPTRAWREKASSLINCHMFQVESNVVVPVEEASDKEEYAAYTIRKKINSRRGYYLKPLPEKDLNNPSLDLNLSKIFADGDFFPRGKIIDLSTSPDQIIDQMDIDHSVKKVSTFIGGTGQAKKHLDHFIAEKLNDYPELSSDPNADCTSHLSPYLHFGQISPIYIALKVMDTESTGKEEFLEQLIVRRELGFNFVYYNQNYDNSLEDILPRWANETLRQHQGDQRDHIYTRDELEKARTHDKYWNAAHMEMVNTGKMHNYMRMYWGKKILEWSKTPQKAYDNALYLNNKYSLDGCDPISFAGIAWCFGKHDRAWAERKIYGKVRYMNANGLKRKFDPDKYADRQLRPSLF